MDNPIPVDQPFRPRIAVVGSGAIGCYYGGRLAAAGQDVHFLMRADLETVRAHGLTIRSVGAPVMHLPSVQAYGRTEEIGPVDLVLIAVKTTSNDALKSLIPPLLHDETAVITLQNGMGNEALLAQLFGIRRVMGALCFVCLNRVAPGTVEHYGHGTISIGEFGAAPQARTHALAAALREAGLEASVAESLIGERWRKLVWNIPFNGVCIAAGGVTTADILADAGLTRLVRELMHETVAIAAANGHPIPDSYAEFQFERTRSMGAYKPSSLLDWWAGRPVEVEAIWGEPYRIGRAAGLDVGRLETLYFLLKKLSASQSAS